MVSIFVILYIVWLHYYNYKAFKENKAFTQVHIKNAQSESPCSASAAEWGVLNIQGCKEEKKCDIILYKLFKNQSQFEKKIPDILPMYEPNYDSIYGNFIYQIHPDIIM